MSPCRNVFAPSPAVDFFGKSRLACFYTCGSSVTLRLGFLTESKSGDNKIATDFPAVPICARGGIGRHDGFRCCHLGERFFRGSSPRTFFGKSRLACFYKRGSSVTLRHGFPRRVKTEDNKIAAGIPAAHICGYGGNGRLGGFRFLCREACGFESHYPYQNEHHPCFEIFYRNTDGFLFGKPRGTRLSAFFVYSLCISGNIKNAKMFLYASVAI